MCQRIEHEDQSDIFAILDNEESPIIKDNFFDKLNNTKKDYSMLLGKEVVDFANNLVKEYEQVKNFINAQTEIIGSFKKELSKNSCLTDKIFQYTLKFNEHEEELTKLDYSTKNNIVRYVRDNFQIEAQIHLMQFEHEKTDEHSKIINITDSESILKFIASITNNGNADEIVRDALLEKLKYELGFEDRIKLTKKKVTISDLLSTGVDYDGKAEIPIGARAAKSFWKTLRCLEVDFYPGMKDAGYSSVDSIENAYTDRHRSPYELNNETTLHDKQFWNGNFFTSSKLFKNGKLEIEFHEEDYAKAFVENYLLMSFKI